jgi:hypothetical protein
LSYSPTRESNLSLCSAVSCSNIIWRPLPEKAGQSSSPRIALRKRETAPAELPPGRWWNAAVNALLKALLRLFRCQHTRFDQDVVGGFSRIRISIPARAGDAQYHPSRAAARDTACSAASGHLSRQGPGPQAIIVSCRPLDLALLVDAQLEIASVRRRSRRYPGLFR